MVKWWKEELRYEEDGRSESQRSRQREGVCEEKNQKGSGEERRGDVGRDERFRGMKKEERREGERVEVI